MPNFSSMWKGVQGAAKAAWGSPVGRSTMIGAGVGGAYGAMSDNTSVLGGAFKGAVAGGVGRTALSAGKIGLNSYKSAMSAYYKRPEALAYAGGRMLRSSTLMANKAVNAISSTLKKWGI